MLPSLQIARLFGIPIKLHWTFYVLGGLFVLASTNPGGVLIAAVLVFGSVLLHELGHSLTARRYGIGTREILLTPIGGIAMLAGMPQKPKGEIVIAVAGPAVNIVLAALTLPFLIPTISRVATLPPALVTRTGDPLGDGVNNLLNSANLGFGMLGLVVVGFGMLNVFLAVFNMLPAFPMDGGRVLRGVLNTPKRGRLKATEIAVTIGRAVAILMALVGLFGLPPWTGQMQPSWNILIIAGFVWFAGGEELRRTRIEDALRNGRMPTAPLDLMYAAMHLREMMARQAAARRGQDAGMQQPGTRPPYVQVFRYGAGSPPPGGPPPGGPPPAVRQPDAWGHEQPVDNAGPVTDARFDYEGQQIIPPRRED